MDEDIETLMIGVRADTQAFAADAAAMRDALQGSLGEGASRAGSLIETGLARAIRSGKLGFDDLEKTALAALSRIAARAVKTGLGSLAGEGSGSGLVSIGASLIGSLLGLPGRATGGPVSPGAAYVVGERGPELFVPTSAGRIAAAAPPSAPREVKVAIHINAPTGAEPRALAQSGRQVARAVAAALARAER